MPFEMKFGKYKGQPITEVPDSYLDYVLGMDNLYPETKAEIEKEQARRRGGDGPATGHGKPAPKPAPAGACPNCQRLRDVLSSIMDNVPF